VVSLSRRGGHERARERGRRPTQQEGRYDGDFRGKQSWAKAMRESALNFWAASLQNSSGGHKRGEKIFKSEPHLEGSICGQARPLLESRCATKTGGADGKCSHTKEKGKRESFPETKTGGGTTHSG